MTPYDRHRSARHHAHAPGAVDEDDVVLDQLHVLGPAGLQLGDDLARPAREVGVEVLVQPAEPRGAVGEPRAGDGLEQEEDRLAVVPGVEERRRRAQVEQERPDPQQVGRDPVELRENHPRHQRALRHRDAGHLLDGLDPREVVDHAGQVVLPRRVRQELRVGPVLRHLLVRPVRVPDHRLRDDDFLAAQLQPHPQHAVGGRVLRPHVQGVGVERVRGGRLSHRAARGPAGCRRRWRPAAP